MIKTPLPLLALVLAGCMSASTTDTPTVSIAQTSDVDPLHAITASRSRNAVGSGIEPTSRVPVDFRFTIKNPLTQPVTLTGVEMETVGLSGGYSMKRVRHNFDQNVAAGSTATVDVRAWVQPLQETETGRVSSAVMIHGIARFDVGGKTVRSAFSAKLAQAGQ